MAATKGNTKPKNTAKTHAFGAETSKVLKLVIHSLYTNKDIFLRELISNASDACEKLRYLAQSDTALLKEDSDLKISLYADEKAGTLTITDNGIGMDDKDLVSNLGTIARSGTEHFFEQLTGDSKKDASLIGQFGVGFYSVFMVADSVTVLTRKAGDKQGFLWESDGEGEFTIAKAEEVLPRGTSITIHFNKESQKYLDKFKLQHIVETYSDHIAFPITYQDAESDAAEVINQGSALWTRPKSEIKPEQYKKFYHHVGHTADEPFLTLHNQVEGKLSYTNLLFIPTIRPFDLFHPDRKRRVKLYVRRVFITDENVDIIPHNLRFLRGIIDSEDLPLNISRETLQDNPVLTQIRESITKKVLGELKKKAQKDADAYAKFWANFGGVLKEGLCDAVTNKEPLLEVCRFHSTKADAGLTGLDDYITRMPEGQEFIYYLTGDRLDSMRTNPQLEGFTKKGIEVLLLNDHVDDFWTTVVPEFKGKRLKSVMTAGKELEKLGKEEASKKDALQEKNDNAEISTLIAALKLTFGDEIKDVRTTGKLTGSPVCLAIEEGGMSMRMERFLVEHKQLPGTSARILEINPDHPIIKALAKTVHKDGLKGDAEDTARILLDQARIIEGEELSDPNAFMQRINALLAKGLVA